MPATHFPASRLIEPPAEALKAATISQNTKTQKRKTGFHPRDNQFPLTEHEGQSELR